MNRKVAGADAKVFGTGADSETPCPAAKNFRLKKLPEKLSLFVRKQKFHEIMEKIGHINVSNFLVYVLRWVDFIDKGSDKCELEFFL